MFARIALFGALLGITTAASFGELSVEAKFVQFKADFGKTYVNATAEDAAVKAFIANDAIINAHNAKGLSYWLGHNEFSDMTWEEFKSKYVGKFNENPTLNRERNFDMSLLNTSVDWSTNSSLDWSTKGAVTPVKNQAQCGSCWAFSTTGSIEGAFQIAGNPLTSLSEQQLVSCDNKDHGGTDQGCNGGLMDNAFTWVSKNPLCTEAAYPYTSGAGSSGACKSTCAGQVTLTGHTDVPGEAGMLAALAIGPVSVAIEADKSAFQLYKGGVLDNAACGKQLDHGVLAMGYGTDTASGKAYYKVKNSWGGTWGESGYIRMVQGKDQCGIADSASYPTGVKQAATPPPTPPTPPTPPPAGPTYTITRFEYDPAWEFLVDGGDVSADLAGAQICLISQQQAFTIDTAIFEYGSTHCDLLEHIDFKTVAKVGDTFRTGACGTPPPTPPPAPTPPTPVPPPTPQTHYGDPSAGCMSDETKVTITDVKGDFCSPGCTSAACPTDVPASVTAKPQCALSNPSGGKSCALVCSPTSIIRDQRAADAQCGTNASCKPIQTVGVCTYDDAL